MTADGGRPRKEGYEGSTKARWEKVCCLASDTRRLRHFHIENGAGWELGSWRQSAGALQPHPWFAGSRDAGVDIPRRRTSCPIVQPNSLPHLPRNPTLSSSEKKLCKSERIARTRVNREGFTGKGERMDETSSSRAPGIATRRVCIADGLQNRLMNLVGEPTNGHTILRNSETRRSQCLCKYEGR